MSRSVQFALFLTIAILILGLAHFYVWTRLVRDTHLAQPWRARATWLIAGLFVATPVLAALARTLAQGPARYLLYPIYVWMGVLFLLFMMLLLSDLVRAIVYGAMHLARGRLPDPERRLFVSRLIGGAVATAATGLGGVAVASALRKVAVKPLELPLARWPRALDGTRIVQLTDVHIGPTLGREFLAEVVRQTNELQPDVVAITGDLVDGDVDSLRDAVAPLGELRARHGVYFVTGNHEYYSGVHQWVAHLPTLGVRVLRNERITIGEGDAAFDLAGVDDHSARGLARGHGPNLRAAVEGRDPARPLILLAHQPRACHEAARHGVDLQLSGHTHGGQIWPWRYLVYLQQPYVSGLNRHGETMVYVSNGTGYWGPPMRLATPAEITLITLRSTLSG